MTVHHRHLVPVLREVPRRRHADHAPAEHQDAHQAATAARCRGVSSSSTTGTQLQNVWRPMMKYLVVLFLTLLTGLTIAVKKKVWKDVH